MSHPEFVHFLLTRFNVKSDARSQLPSDDWLRERLEIFRQWSLQSVRSQTVRPDFWLIFCDADSPQWFRNEIAALLQLPGEEVVWVDGHFTRQMLAEVIAKRLGEKQYLITTRLDNDDAISCDYLGMVQGCFRQQEMEFINFTCGAQYGDGRFFARIDPSNAFVSLIERRSSKLPLTVHIDWHNRLDRHAPVNRVKSHFAWLQHVHGANIANVVRGVPVRPEEVLKYFCLSVPVRTVGRMEFWLRTLVVTTRLAFRVLSSPYRLRWLLQSLRSKARS